MIPATMAYTVGHFGYDDVQAGDSTSAPHEVAAAIQYQNAVNLAAWRIRSRRAAFERAAAMQRSSAIADWVA